MTNQNEKLQALLEYAKGRYSDLVHEMDKMADAPYYEGYTTEGRCMEVDNFIHIIQAFMSEPTPKDSLTVAVNAEIQM